MKLIKMFPILIAMLLVAVFIGCEKDEEQGVRPTVTSSDPVNEAKGVALNSSISATFSAPMDATSITGSGFTLHNGNELVSSVTVYNGTTASLTPNVDLLPNTLYSAAIKGVKDAQGKSIAKDYTWTFTTGAAPDNTAPTVSLSSPLNNALAVTLSNKVSITFSEAMDQTTITALTFTLRQGTTVVPGAVTYSDMTATFTPAVDPSPKEIYTATITTAAKDMAGNALAVDHVIIFTTAAAQDIALPMVNATMPLNNETDVAVNQKVMLTFSEAMDTLTIISSSFTLKQGANAVSGLISYSAKTATFTPSADLEAGALYTVLLTNDATDLAGNALASDHTFSFTTVATPDTKLPLINATDPLNNATNIARNKAISATFSESMDVSTISTSTFSVSGGGSPVSGTVTYSGTNATFTPSNILDAGTVYTATITNQVLDLAGNALAANTVWSFTTSASAATLAVVDLGTAGDYAILAKTAISNIATSAITGHIALSPAATSYITGFPLTNATGYASTPEVTGKVYAADMASPTDVNLTTAVENMITAYNDAAGRPSPDFLELGTGAIGGLILTPGLYKWTTTVTLPSDVIISGGANDVWIFQISGDLTMSSAVNITLQDGAQAKNIFWQVAGEATIGTTAHFEGIVLSMTAITFQTGASMNGRALAQTAVILDGNAVTQPQ